MPEQGMPEQEEKAAEVKQPVAGGVPATSPGAAPTGAPQWIADILADAAKGAEFLKFTRSTYDEDFKKHTAASAERERSLRGMLTASDYWKNLDEEGREAVKDAATQREDAIEVWSERVPKEILEMFSTAKAVRQGAQAYIKATGSKAAEESRADDLEARIAAGVAKALGRDTPGAERKDASWANLQGGRRSAAGAQELKDIRFDPRGGHVKQMLKAQRDIRGT